jgi:uncharacterized Zn-binding protein involved in type VI secretion
MINVLLQTTIEANADDWEISRFGLLRSFLEAENDEEGNRRFRVTARDRESIARPDPVLSTLASSSFDEVWLFAVDTGNGLTAADCAGISEFRRAGGGLLVARDHMDLGSSICTVGGIGAAHHFHSKNLDPDVSRRTIDDTLTAYISWPNYHSGANGDYQRVQAVGEPHPVLNDPQAPNGVIRFLPAHPHEGSVSAPAVDHSARVILTGDSAVSGKQFNIAVAFEGSERGGRALAHSTFHHFADYNWDPSRGSPSFVSEARGFGMERFPEALRSTKQFVKNAALWLGSPFHG